MNLKSSAAQSMSGGDGGGKLWALLESHLSDKHTLVVCATPTIDDEVAEMERKEAEAAELAKKKPMMKAASQASLTASSNNGREPNSGGNNVQMQQQPDTATPSVSSEDGGSAGWTLENPPVSGDGPRGTGLLAGGGYSLLAIKHAGLGLHALCQLKQPFTGGGGTYQGEWGRDSKKWAAFPDVAQDLESMGGVPRTSCPPDESGEERWAGSDDDDGTFWMTYSAFKCVFARVYACRVFPDGKFKQYCVHGEWIASSAVPQPISGSFDAPESGNGNGNAGGGPLFDPHPRMAPDASAGGSLRLSPNDVEVLAAVETPRLRPGKALPKSLDGLNYTEALALKFGNEAAYGTAAGSSVVFGSGLATKSASWFTNPQFAVSVANGDEPVVAHVSLLQEERRRPDKLYPNLAVGFTVLRSKPATDPNGNQKASNGGNGGGGEGLAPQRAWAADRSSGHELVFDSSKAPLLNGGSGWAGPSGGVGAGAATAQPIQTPSSSATREVAATLTFAPGYVYTVVPHTEQQGIGARFVLRVFCANQADLSVVPVPAAFALKLEGEWAKAKGAGAVSAAAAPGSGPAPGPVASSAGGPLLTVQTPPKVVLTAAEETAAKAKAKSAALFGNSAAAATSGSKSSRPNLALMANPAWCENPQYVLRLPASLPPSAVVHATLVLRRTDLIPKSVKVGKIPRPGPNGVTPPQEEILVYDDTAPAIGLLVAKVPASEDPASRRRRTRADNAGRTNALGEPLPVKESSLKHKPRAQVLMDERAASLEASPEGGGASVPGELPRERKMTVSAKEWHLCSDYANRAVATLSLPPLTRSFAPDGLVVVPSLSSSGEVGRFSLEVHSDCPGIRIEPLAEGRAKTISSAWTKESAGGNHMHKQTWKKNPKFHLRLAAGVERATVKVTLSRPTGPWKPNVTKDSLGCMLGLYLCKGPNAQHGGLPGDEIWHEGEPWSETAFVPANAVSTPAGFELPGLESGEVYTIVCATFEPGKVGPFVLSVTADADFSLTQVSADPPPKAAAPAASKGFGGKGGGFGGFASKLKI